MWKTVNNEILVSPYKALWKTVNNEILVSPYKAACGRLSIMKY